MLNPLLRKFWGIEDSILFPLDFSSCRLRLILEEQQRNVPVAEASNGLAQALGARRPDSIALQC